MLFPTITKVPVSEGDLVAVKPYKAPHGNGLQASIFFQEGAIVGIIDKIKGDSFWLKASPEPDAYVAKFSFKIDQIMKLN